LQDIFNDPETYSLKDTPISNINFSITVAELHRKFRDQELSPEQFTEVQEIFGRQDVFEPLITIVHSSFTTASVEKLGSLMYLAYQIDNPFRGSSLEAKEITKRAQKKSKLKLSKSNKDKVIEMVDELVLTASSFKSAWAFFGSYQAKEVLELLLDENYRRKLLKDFEFFAQQNLLVCPPQLLCLLKQLPDLLVDNNSTFVDKLKAFYNTDGSLAQLTEKLNYQITGLQRANEYPQQYLEEYIPTDSRHGLTLSFGGAVGLIEVERAKRLKQNQGGIVIFDKKSRDESLSDTLVLENELAYKAGNPWLTREQIRDIQDSSPIPLNFIKTQLPLSYEQIKQSLQQSGIDTSLPIKTIYDQRASALYLKDQELFDSIRTSIDLLRDNGGTYFLTRGYADRLFVDQVIRIESTNNQQITPLLLHHTNSFFAHGIKGLIPIYKTPLYIAEGGSRRGSHLEFFPFQEERVAAELINQRVLYLINMVANKFDKKQRMLISYPQEGITFSHYLVYAYAVCQDLPLFVMPCVPPESLWYYQKIIETLVEVITIYKQNENLLKNLDFSLPEPPYGFEFTFSVMTVFLKEIKKNSDILKIPLEQIETLMQNMVTPEIIYKNVQIGLLLEKLPAPVLLEKVKSLALESRIRHDFHEKFDLRIQGTGYFDFIIADAVLNILNIPYTPSIWKNMTEEQIIDYYHIIEEIRKKILYSAIGIDYKMKLLNLNDPDFFWNLVYGLNCYQDSDLWERVNAFIDQNADIRSAQAVAV
jgi:hypothetical protein